MPPATTVGVPVAVVCTEDSYAETLTGALFAQDETEWMIELTPEQAEDVADSVELTGPDGASSHVLFAAVVGACVDGQASSYGFDQVFMVTIGRDSPDQPWEIISYESLPL
ncbi:MAG: hypothetical protein MUP76_04355 [Acidimicrobiia bacterium]|nr:hypothetical protein [Acidimicrobiia bacterium]